MHGSKKKVQWKSENMFNWVTTETLNNKSCEIWLKLCLTIELSFHLKKSGGKTVN